MRFRVMLLIDDGMDGSVKRREVEWKDSPIESDTLQKAIAFLGTQYFGDHPTLRQTFVGIKLLPVPESP